MKKKLPAVKRKTKRRSRAQVEADRRLSSLRQNLAKEIEADFDRFAGNKPSAAAGLMVLTRMKIILAFLQAFFPMFISAPKPRKIKREIPNKRKRRRVQVNLVRGSVRKKKVKKKSGAGAKLKGIRVVKLQQEKDPTISDSGYDSNLVKDGGVDGEARAISPLGAVGASGEGREVGFLPSGISNKISRGGKNSEVERSGSKSVVKTTKV